MPATLVQVDAVESLDVKATLIADILTAIYGDSASELLDYKPSPLSWKSVSDYASGIFKAARKLRTTAIGRDPRDGDGDGIIFDGTPQEQSAQPAKKRGAKPKNTPEKIQAVHARIDAALKGNKSPESASEIADMLGELTVKELRDVKIKFGISASGKVKSELVAKIAKRLDAGRRADHSMNPQTGNGIRLTEKDKYYLRPIVPKTDGLTPGGKSYEFAKRQATALNNLLDGKPLSAEDRKIVTEAIIKDFTYMSTAGGGVAGSHRDARIAATRSILEQMGINPNQELEKYRESQKEREIQQTEENRIFRRMGPESTPDSEPRKPMRLASERAERARREVEEARRIQAEKEAAEASKTTDKPAEQQTKPGHELTLQEYRDKYGKAYGDNTDSVHRRLVQRAMERGEKVSDEVLDSHPDLKPKAPVAKQVYQRPRQLAHHSLTATDPQGRYTDEQIAQRQAIDRAQYALDVYNVAPERYTGGPIDQQTVDRLISRYPNAAPKMWDGIDTSLTDEDRARISGKPMPVVEVKQETEEPFTLSRSTPKTPKVATFENNEANKQGALFDTGKNDLPGQELLFNTDAGDVTNPKTMENRIAGERVSPQPQGRDLAEVLKRSSKATKDAVNSRAKKLGVDPVEYFKAVEDAYRIESQNHAQRERMKRTAREYTGLTSAEIARVENRYQDHDSVMRFDDSVKAMRDAYPELEYMEDANDFVWTLIREGKKDPKPRHHPDVLRAADEMIASNKRTPQRQLAYAGGSGGSETLEAEDDWVPVEHRGWIKWLKQQNATPFNQGPMSIAMVSKALFSRAMMLKAQTCNADIDGDGDGIVCDGTPQERSVAQAVEGEQQPVEESAQQPQKSKQTFGGLFRNILTDPTRADRSFVGEHLKNMATFKLDQDSLLRKAFEQITFDPTKADRESLVEYAKDVVKLKPVANALKTMFDPGPGVREAMEIARDTTKTIRWVADKTLGAMFRMLSRDMRRSAANGPRNANFKPYTITGPMPGNMRVRSFKSADTEATANPFDLTGIDHTPYIDMVVEMVKTDSIDEVNQAIVTVMEHVLRSRQPKSDQVTKALFNRAAMLLKEVDTATLQEIKDGDGDGMIYDGTPQERSANPSAKKKPKSPTTDAATKTPATPQDAATKKPATSQKPQAQPKPSPLQKVREQKGSEPIGKKQPEQKPKLEHTAKPSSYKESKLHEEAKHAVKSHAEKLSPEETSKWAKQYQSLADETWNELPFSRNEADTDKMQVAMSRASKNEAKRYAALLKKAKEFDQKAELYAHFAENPEAAKEKIDYTPPVDKSFDDMIKLRTSAASIRGASGPQSWSDIDSYTQDEVQQQWTQNRQSDREFLEWAGEEIRGSIDVEDVIRSNIDDLLENAEWDNLDVGQRELSDQIESVVKDAVNASKLKIGKEMTEADSETLKQILTEAAPDWKNGSLSDQQVSQIIDATNQALMASDPDEVNLATEAEIADIIQIDEDDAVSQFYEAWRRGRSWAESDVNDLIDAEVQSQLESDEILQAYADQEWENLDSEQAFEAAVSLGYATDSDGYGDDATNDTLQEMGVDDAASFVGAPDDTEVEIQGDKITVTGRGGFEMIRTISEGTIHADLFRIGNHYGGQATEILAQMVKQARAAGFDTIETYAAGSIDNGSYNGYYTWPCMGYDQEISGLRQEAQIRQLFPGVETIQDLYEQPGGRDWWFVNGSGLSSATFDLSDGSRSMRVMERYLNEKLRKT